MAGPVHLTRDVGSINKYGGYKENELRLVGSVRKVTTQGHGW
jgi:hypothetical protein